MKSLLCREFDPLEGLALEEVSSPIAGNGQVVFAVKAAGVNFPDTLIVQGKYQIRPSLPFAPGGVFAGVVKAIDIHEFKHGKIVRTWHTEDWMCGLHQLGVFDK